MGSQRVRHNRETEQRIHKTSTETTKPVSDFQDEDLHRSLAIHLTLCFHYCRNLSVYFLTMSPKSWETILAKQEMVPPTRNVTARFFWYWIINIVTKIKLLCTPSSKGSKISATDNSCNGAHGFYSSPCLFLMFFLRRNTQVPSMCHRTVYI